MALQQAGLSFLASPACMSQWPPLAVPVTDARVEGSSLEPPFPSSAPWSNNVPPKTPATARSPRLSPTRVFSVFAVFIDFVSIRLPQFEFFIRSSLSPISQCRRTSSRLAMFLRVQRGPDTSFSCRSFLTRLRSRGTATSAPIRNTSPLLQSLHLVEKRCARRKFLSPDASA